MVEEKDNLMEGEDKKSQFSEDKPINNQQFSAQKDIDMSEAHKTPGRWVTTVAGVALILSVICFIYIAKNIPALHDNAYFYNEKFVEIQNSIDQLSRQVVNLDQKICAGSYDREIAGLKQAILVLDDVLASSSGDIENKARQIKENIQSLIDDLLKATKK